MEKKSFTLIELMMVVVVAAILVAAATPFYFKALDRASEREAVSQIRLIQGAERMLMLDQGGFATCANTAACNLALDLDLPTANPDWDFAVIGDAAAISISASRIGGTCVYGVNTVLAEPVITGGTCVGL